MLKNKIRILYCEELGKTLKQHLNEQKIPQNSIFYYDYDEAVLISASTISQILKGKRNISLETVDALQETLNLPDIKSVFFPNIDFCESLIIQLTNLILTENYASTRRLFQIKEKEIHKNLLRLATSLYDFFPTLPAEETSYQIAESITDWMIEFVALVAQL
ncbi:helix-turn-helix domain-containing protein [Streptococcus pluranimalium]|uniref:helix-turn-helix domain-containing protein n=1 Tax=Streptococcus pluranimalium TaxID=82348 RepID=UPI003F68C5C3